MKEAGTSETAENGSDDKAADKAEFISAGRFRNLVDGVYTGSADAFRGDVEVQSYCGKSAGNGYFHLLIL